MIFELNVLEGYECMLEDDDYTTGSQILWTIKILDIFKT